MILSILFIIVGIVLLVYGGNFLVNGASNVARNFGISELIVGLTVVSFGTSAPELVVSIMSAMEGHSEIALGNVIGSNNFNLFIVLGASGLMAALGVGRDMVRRDIPLSFLFAALLLLFGNNYFFFDGEKSITRIDALILIALLLLYFALLFRSAKKDKHKDFISVPDITMGRATIYIIGGLASLVGGGKLVLTGAVDIAYYFGMSEKVIGLTIVAAGTSLPELVTSVVASYKGKVDMAIGNVIGSNIFNILLILGVSCIIKPISYDVSFNIDIHLLLGGTLLLMAFVASKPHRLVRWQSVIFIVAYVAYTIYLIRN